jgi:acetyl esterase/lipase
MIFDCDVRYGDHDKAWLDVMVPDGDGPFPLVICVHGGGWQAGRKDDIHQYAEWLLPLGIASILPNYRLTDIAAHPAQEEDIFAALDWACAHKDEYGFDLSRVGLTGVSAGGHLTAQVGCRGSQSANDKPYTIRCMYPVCPPTDMARFVEDNPDIRPVIEALIGGSIEDKQEALIDVSPMTHIHDAAPACCCAHGDVDELVPFSQSVMFADALTELGIEAEVVIVPGAEHTAQQPGTESAEPLGGLDRFQKFFSRHLVEA